MKAAGAKCSPIIRNRFRRIQRLTDKSPFRIPSWRTISFFLLFLRNASQKFTLYLSLRARSILWQRSVKNDGGFAWTAFSSDPKPIIVERRCVQWSVILYGHRSSTPVVLAERKTLWKIISDICYIIFVFVIKYASKKKHLVKIIRFEICRCYYFNKLIKHHILF